jgi:acetylornithine deacetylase/succinyl-diaminopimelate desuccinylase-like protein
VAIPSVTTDTAACGQAIDWVKDRLAGLPLHVTETSHDGHPAIVFTTQKTKRPKVLLLGHLDVIPPSHPQDFTLREDNGKYYGRGAFDMKFAVAAYVKLLQDLGPELPKYDLGLMLTTDEEPSINPTAAELVRRGWGAEVVINADAIPDWPIEEAAKGYARYRVHSRGERGHGSRPWLYRNALRQLITYLLELEELFKVDEPCGDEEHRHHTFSVNTMSAGLAFNQIPGEAEAQIEFRLVPGETVAGTEKVIYDLVEKHSGVSVVPLSVSNPTSIDKNHPYVQRFKHIIAETIGREPHFSLSHGTSDNPAFIEAGMLVLMTSPAGGGAHSDGEWIDIQGIQDFYDIVRRFVTEAAILAG